MSFRSSLYKTLCGQYFGLRLVPTPLTPGASNFLHNPFTMLHISHSTVVQVGILQTWFRACRPHRAKGDLKSMFRLSCWRGLSLDFKAYILCFDVVWLWICHHLNTTRGFMSLQKVFHSVTAHSAPAPLSPITCSVSLLYQVSSKYSNPFQHLTWCEAHVWLSVADTADHLNSGAVTGIINIHISWTISCISLYFVFPVFPDHLKIHSMN